MALEVGVAAQPPIRGKRPDPDEGSLPLFRPKEAHPMLPKTRAPGRVQKPNPMLDRPDENSKPSTPIRPAIQISGAGTEAANGIYRATAREHTGAPIFEHIVHPAFTITREPHKSAKTGKTKHGWLLSDKQSGGLYGSPTELLSVPVNGWKQFGGTLPIPEVTVFAQVKEAFFATAAKCEHQAKIAIENEEWQQAVAALNAGLEALDSSGERFGDPFEGYASKMLSQRANVRLHCQETSVALRDAIAALEIIPGLPQAKEVACKCVRELGCKEWRWIVRDDDPDIIRALAAVGKGKILDRAAPLALDRVDKFVAGLKVVLSKPPVRQQERFSSVESDEEQEEDQEEETEEECVVDRDHNGTGADENKPRVLPKPLVRNATCHMPSGSRRFVSCLQSAGCKVLS